MAPGVMESCFRRWRDDGDVAALARVFDALAPELLAIARHLAPDRATAEDLVQATFVAAIESAANFDERRELMPWLVGILNNKVKLALALRARRIDPRRIEERIAEDPALDAEMREFVAALARALQRVPERYREVLERHLVRGERPEEIAHALQRESGAVRVQIHRGLAKLRRVLPTSFAVGLSISLTDPRGLAAVRADVLIAGRAALVASSAAPLFIGASIVTSKVLWSVVVAIAAVSVLMISRGGSAAFPSSAQTRVALEAQHSSESPLNVDGEAKAQRIEVPLDSRDPNASPTTSSKLGALKFEVTWHDGTPAEGVELELERVEKPESANDCVVLRTDADGRAEARDLIAALYDVFSDRSSVNLRSPVTQVRVLEGRTQAVQLQLARGYDFAGVVLDVERKPVANATIWGYNAFGSIGYPVGTSASDGSFELRSLIGDMSLMATADGFGASEPFEHRAERARTAWAKFFAQFRAEQRVFTGLELVLDGSSASFEGTVLGADGELIEGARVGWMRPNFSRGGRILKQALFVVATDEHGHFQLGGMRAGSGELVAWAPGHAMFREHSELVDRHPTRFDVRLDHGATIVGRVTDAQGAPIEGARVAGPNVWRYFRSIESHSDVDGSFRLQHVEPGEFRLAATLGKHGAQKVVEQLFDVAHGDEVEWNVVFAPGRIISGRAVDTEAKPCAKWTVRAKPSGDENSTLLAQATTAADGSFTLENLQSATYDLSLIASDGSALVGTLTSVASDSTDVVLTGDRSLLPSVTVSGRVVDAFGEPCRAKVNAFSNKHGPNGVITKANGSFELGPLQPGDIQLWVEPVGLQRIELRASDVAPHSNHSFGRIVIPEPGVLEVVLLREDGVELIAPSSRLSAANLIGGSLYDDGSGVLTSGKVYPGVFQLVSSARNGLEQRTEIELKAGEVQRVEVTLTPAARRRITIEALDGAPLGSVHMLVDSTSTGRVFERDRRAPKASSSSLHALPFGGLRIEVRAQDGRTATVTVEHSPAHAEDDAIVLQLR